MPDELAYVTATDLAARIRRRELSPVEVIDATIARIEATHERLNAFVYRGFDDARAAAAAAERVLVAGGDLGSLHGVPTAMKDLFNYKPGWPTTLGGVRALKDWIATHASVFPERIEAAGAILVGKCNSPVMGFRGTCDNPLFGPSRNPFDLSKNTGGSSGGSAGAVAGGLVPFAEGTDGGGSIRIPAAWCGVFGYKASFGRVPFVNRPNAFSGVTPFLFVGPIARTVEDAALALDALAGQDSRDPFSIETHGSFLPATRRSVAGMRIAWSPDFGGYPIDRRVAEVCAEAVLAFADAGCDVEEVALTLPADQRELSDVWCRLISLVNIEAFENFKEGGLDLLADHRDDFPAPYLRWIETGAAMDHAAIARDQQVRTSCFDLVQGVLDTYDLLVTPTLACPPVDNAHDGQTQGPTRIGGVEVDPLIGWCLTYLINFSGHPAASVPAGLDRDGLPVGLQVIGRRHADADVLAASAAFERVRPWQHHYERVTANLS